jgi:hypothetical protein
VRVGAYLFLQHLHLRTGDFRNELRHVTILVTKQGVKLALGRTRGMNRLATSNVTGAH